MWVGWADVGLWVAVCFLAKISLHRRTCKTTFARLTQSQAISQSFRAFISFRWRRDTTFFSFLETLFYTKLPFPLPWLSKDLLVDKHAGGGQSTSKSTCEVPARTLTAFGDRSASSMSKWRPAWTLTPEMIHFRTKSVTLSMLIDLLIIVHVDRRRWRAHQLTYDLKRCLLFRKCLRFFESESSFGAYVCHRRPGGSMATSHLVAATPKHQIVVSHHKVILYRIVSKLSGDNYIDIPIQCIIFIHTSGNSIHLYSTVWIAHSP